MTTKYTSARAAADIIDLYKPDFKPEVGIILGSGLGGFAQYVEDPVIIPYYKLPGFHHGAVEGHANNLLLGHIKGTAVACLQGRPHFYEGVSHEIIRTWPRALKSIGCEMMLLTSAVGSLDADKPAGSLMLVNDHINFQGTNPLIGPNDAEYGERFFSMENAYDLELRQEMLTIADKLDIKLPQGVYVSVIGPCFETPAEIKAFRILGADVVGMSTVQEVIAARHCGLKVLCLAVITNLAAGMNKEELSHAQTLRCAQLATADITKLVLTFCEKYKLNMNKAELAQRMLPLIDLTSLNDVDDEAVIKTLCQQAVTPRGNVAAVCVYPKFVALAKECLTKTNIKVATVVNFPGGDQNLDAVLQQTQKAIADGADEIDMVIPYLDYLVGNTKTTKDLVTAGKNICGPNIHLKVILETGALAKSKLIAAASRDVIAAGADFLKTSTGKIAVGATPEAAKLMLTAIRESKKPVGFKASGGIRTVVQAAEYLQIADSIMGKGWATPATFRFGASSLLVDILE